MVPVALAVKILLADGDQLSAPFLLRIGGWTEEQYFREAPESAIVEFADGEVIVHSPAGVEHQDITGFLSVLQRAYVRRRNLGRVLNGPAVVRLRPGLDYEPDIFFVPRDRIGLFTAQYFAGAPALVVEITSESTRTHDAIEKAAAYRQHGVPEYWVVHPDRRTLLQHLLPEGGQGPYRVLEHRSGRVQSAAIPGFWIDVSWLWQDPLPDELHCLDQILAP